MDFFSNPDQVAQKQYEALRSFYLDKMSAKKVAKKYSVVMGKNEVVLPLRKTKVWSRPGVRWILCSGMG